MSISTPLPQLTDLGRRLAVDSQGVLYKQITRTLEERLEQLGKTAAAGLPPDEYEKTGQEIEALKAGQRIVEIIWSIQNAGHGAQH